MPELRLRGLVKTFGPARALDGAELSLRGGEVHALMGENGAGKSTMIRILAGLDNADAGEVTLNGAPLRLGSPAMAKAAGLRFLHQENHVVPALNVAENMHLARPYPQRFGLVNWTALRQAATDALGRLGASHIDARSEMGSLGAGDQMLVRIAATLLADEVAPWAYIMDEPTAALTGAEAAALFRAIGELKAAGAAILYVSHRMDEVMALADRITVLRDGAHVATRDRAETTRDEIIRDMTGRDMATLFPQRMASSGSPALAVRDLRAAGLGPVSFEMVEGEILGIAGLSGSGREVLLRALIGAVPRAGDLELRGVPLAADPAGAWAQGLAYVPPERRTEGVMPRRALAETVTLPHLSRLANFGFFRQGRATRLVRRLAEDVRLKATGPNQPVAELSGGNQQKVLFARALAGDPALLLLDEPTRGVDVGAKFDIYTLIRDLAAKGAMVIIVSSDLPELIGLSDRIAVLNAGRITETLPAAGLTEAALLTACYKRES
ncbi:MAG: sugar ABC transporter ATP-binding protein [Rhodobacteraceae bacterium]|nr:sugar ABC transporter ATP-binding protein [Paracoccaceae bacterium]